MTLKHISEFTAVVFVFFTLMLIPVAGNSEERPGVNYYIDGAEEYDAGLYETALKSLGKAIELEPANLDYQYYYAMTYSAMERYPEAESIYTVIINTDPKTYYKAYFDMAAIYTKRKDYEKALKIVSDAEWVVPNNARLYLEKGMIFKQMKRYKTAVNNYKRALELDPKLSQTVNYNIGLVHFSEKDYKAARKMFQQVINEKPDTKIAEYSRVAISGIEDMVKLEKPWKVHAYIGYSYDDNISEDPLDHPGHISSLTEDTDGQYQVFFLKGEYRLLKTGGFGFSTGYKFTYINFNDSEHENSLSNSPYLLLKYNIQPVYMSLQYDFAHYFADSDNRQIQHTIKPSMTILEPWNMRTDISFSYQMKDYKSDAPTEDETVFTAGLVQSIFIPELKLTPRFGFKFGDEDSDSDADTNYYIESSIGLGAELPYKLTCDLSVTDIRTDYKEVAGVNREDTGYLIEVALGRALTKAVSTKLYYGYTHNKSNVTDSSGGQSFDPYKYDVNHVRLSFSMSF